jgi:hypothetical protein
MEIQDQKPDLIRKSHYAGNAYPADPVELSELIGGLLRACRGKAEIADLRALVAPRPDDFYRSGAVVNAMRSLKGQAPVTLVLIAAAEQIFFDKVSVFNGGAYETPLGRVFVDLTLAEKIANIHPKVVFSNSGHHGGKQSESVIEMALPVLQMVVGSFKLVPVVMGNQETDNARALGEVLAATLHHSDAIMIACSDLRFSTSTEPAQRMVQGVEDAITRLDWQQVNDRLSGTGSMRAAPLISTIYACKRLRITTTTITRLPETLTAPETGENDAFSLSVAFSK